MIKENSRDDAVSDAIQEKQNKKQKFYIVAVDCERELRECAIEKRNFVGEMIKGYVFYAEG